MPIRQISITGLRNLKQAVLQDCCQVNIIAGPNGSGKTSILEAIHLLGLGRSFRSTKLKPIINFDMNEATVFASFEREEFASIGVRKSKNGKQDLKINREPVSQLSHLAEALPLQVINSDSFMLIDGGPKSRRQFIDWGVFHVKQDFLALWRRAQRALKQRNSLLRHDKISPADLSSWDRELAFCADMIDQQRAEYIAALYPFFRDMLSRLLELEGVEVAYERGWQQGESLAALLQQGYQRDRARGYTHAGPHRANLEITYLGKPAVDILSRGQQKLVVCALKLAQGFCFSRQTGKKSLYLLDDLPAELDLEHRERLCTLLHEMESQVFISCVDADSLLQYWPDGTDLKEFHVKQGSVEALH